MPCRSCRRRRCRSASRARAATVTATPAAITCSASRRSRRASPSPSRSRPGRSRERCGSTCARRRKAARPRRSWRAPGCSTTATPCCTGIPGAATRPATRRASRASPSSSASTARRRTPPDRPRRGAPRSTHSCSPSTPSSCCASTRRRARACTTSITSGGGAPNVVPEFAEGFFYVRHPKAEVAQATLPAASQVCAGRGARDRDEARGAVPRRDDGDLPNNTLAQVAKKNLTALNDLKYDAEEMKFAVRLQETFAEKAAARGRREGVRLLRPIERRIDGRGRRVVGGAGDRASRPRAGCRARRGTRGRRWRAAARRSARRG